MRIRTLGLPAAAALVAMEGGGPACPTEGEFVANYIVRRANPVGKLYVAS